MKNVQAVDEYLCDRDALLCQLRVNLLAAQNRMKIQADQKHRDVEFCEGDLVFVKLQSYKQISVANRLSNKLAPKYFGPYKILKRVGSVAYQLQLPQGSLIHDVFHVSLLRRCEGEALTLNPVVLDETALTPPVQEPEYVLDEWVIAKGKYRPKIEILVKWVGKNREEATWETKRRFAKAYPYFNLADKLNASGVDYYKPAKPDKPMDE
ncbi:uncharacterized protein LOC143556616 [Bidens hawaiensis]|uniref:uncharacterized protein LOC143556616 n=1 Tax=Bidens hawaiensis TaxID=980011 RepID=UPI00404AC9EB